MVTLKAFVTGSLELGRGLESLATGLVYAMNLVEKI